MADRPVTFVLACSPSSAGTSPSLLSITDNGDGTWNVNFSSAVTIDTGVAPDTNLHVNDQSPQTVALSSPTVVNVDFGLGDLNGQPWSLDAQPNWLLTPVTNPASGTVV